MNMLSIRSGFSMAAVGLAAISASAQVNLVIIDKAVFTYQQGPSTIVADDSNPFGNFGFDADVSGTNISGITAPVVTLPAASTYPSQAPAIANGGVLVYNVGDQKWEYGINGNDIATSSSTNVNSFFATGTYSVTLPGGTVNIPFGSNISSSLTFNPVMTFSQGTWSGTASNAVLTIDPSQPLTISTTDANYNRTAGGQIGAELFLGLEGVFQIDDWGRVAPTGTSTTSLVTGFVSYTIPADTLTPGMTYLGGAEYANYIGQSTEVAGVLALAGFRDVTSFNIVAAPEPSSGALIAGGAALALWLVRRRRATGAGDTRQMVRASV
jgi:hypothetical protein